MALVLANVQSRLCHFKAVWLWGKRLTFLTVSFLISKSGLYRVALLFEDTVS